MYKKKVYRAAKQFVSKANALHNNKYTYSMSRYVKASVKIVIHCKKHGAFLQTPNSHLNGSGCPKCGYLTNTRKKNYS